LGITIQNRPFKGATVISRYYPVHLFGNESEGILAFLKGINNPVLSENSRPFCIMDELYVKLIQKFDSLA
jgi:hypothetical protein